jgi:YqjK-like protein
MTDRQLELVARREALRAETARQREHMDALARDIQARLSGIDRSIDMVRTVAAKPLVIAGAIAVVALVGPRRLLSIAGRGAMFLTTGGRVLKMLRR